MLRTLKQFVFGQYDSIGLNNKGGRDRWIARKLSEVPANQSILDVGAGECQYKPMCKHLRYSAQDFGEYDGKGDGHGQQTGTWNRTRIDIVSDILAIPVEANSFDSILCTEVLEHVPDPTGALKEMHRILKPGGRLIITAPFCSFTHFSPYHFSTGFSRYWWQHWLNATGFDINELVGNGNYFEFVGQELRHAPDVAKQYGGTTLTWIQKLALRVILGFLQINSAKCVESEDLSVFGFHAVATKRP